MRGLAGKGVLVTGGSSGIGLATVGRFLREGSRVFLCGIDDAEVARALEGFRSAPVAGMTCDVSLPESAPRLVEEAERFLGRVDVLVNNAGIATKDRFLDIPLEDWDRTIAVNLS